MKVIKRLTAALLVMLMVLTVAGCHKKDEVAVTIDGVEFTSAYYMCALIMADSEARQKVDEQIAEEAKDDEESTATQQEVDYFKQKIDKKDFSDWVKDKAIENLKQNAAYILKCQKAKVELDDETKSGAEQYAAYYWSYGYSAMLEPNGVSQATYVKYMTDSYYASEYFEHLYGKGGEKEIADTEVNTKMLENFVVADVIEVDTSSMKDEEKTSTKAKLDGYLADLTAGTKTFEDVYHDYNGTKKEEAHKDDTTAEDNKKEPGSAPLDSHATIIGNEDTGYDSDLFKDVKAMANGEIKLIEKAEKKGYALVIKKDISADPYYAKNLDLTVRNLIKGDEFEKDMEAFAKTLKPEINNYAVNQFKVKKIVYPEAAQ